jgi:alpha-tubulin suppressor-like RCC1 family protein
VIRKKEHPQSVCGRAFSPCAKSAARAWTQVYTWGDGEFGQLGHSNSRPEGLPKKVRGNIIEVMYNRHTVIYIYIYIYIYNFRTVVLTYTKI